MTDDEKLLPVLQADSDEDAPSCSPTVFVSNEEAALLSEMRSLRERSIELRAELRTADRTRRERLEAEIGMLRRRWHDLAARREQAFIRKMIMLGHLPPDHPVER